MRVGRYINEVCEMLDLTVLVDIDVVPYATEEQAAKNEFTEKIRTFVAIGQEAEPGAGLRGIMVTKWFESEDQLDEFCELNINRFRIASQSGEVVDATEWR